MINASQIIFFLLAYFLGSFPTAYLIVKKFANKDIREEQSKNVGSMNVMRITGKVHLFLLSVLGDAGKGALAVLIPQWLGHGDLSIATASSFGVILGHCYSIYFKMLDGHFYGGKAQASLIGVLGILNFKYLLLPWASLSILFVLATQTFFFGQFMANLLLPLVGYYLVPEYSIASLLMALPIFIKQWPHFIPALKGARPKWYFKKKN
ncbi:MAG: glycerol-3-phosphate acyltransferase [Patescibacteria group bacterium]